MDPCASDGSPAFSLLATSVLMYLVAVVRALPLARSLSARQFYAGAAVVVVLLGWLTAQEVCDAGMPVLARLRLVGVNTALVLGGAALTVYLRARHVRRRR